MDDLDQQLLAKNPAWQQVLQAYLNLTSEPIERGLEQTGPRWADRIPSLNDIVPDQLSKIHGQLIALGWLKFQFEPGQTGLLYRVSSEGRTELNRVNGTLAVAAAPQSEAENLSEELAA